MTTTTLTTVSPTVNNAIIAAADLHTVQSFVPDLSGHSDQLPKGLTHIEGLALTPQIRSVFSTIRAEFLGSRFTDGELAYDIADSFHRLGIENASLLLGHTIRVIDRLTGCYLHADDLMTPEAQVAIKKTEAVETYKEECAAEAQRAAVAAVVVAVDCGCGRPATHRVVYLATKSRCEPRLSAKPQYCLLCAAEAINALPATCVV